MATYLNHATVAAARNGTTTHTVHPDGTGGTVVDGAGFTPTTGRFLLCCVYAAVTFTTPTGWTLPDGGSAVNLGGLYIFYRSPAAGTSADQIATTHNVSNYPAVFDFYEFAAGSFFVAAASQAVTTDNTAGPTLSGLSGVNWTAGVMGQANSIASTFTTTWNAGTEEVDTSVAGTPTDGYTYSLTYTADNAAASAVYTADSTRNTNQERLVVAVRVAGPSPGIVVEITKAL